MNNETTSNTETKSKPRYTRRAKILGGFAAGAVVTAGAAVGIAEMQDHVKTPGQIVQNEEVRNGQVPSPTQSETQSSKPKPTDVNLAPATQNLKSPATTAPATHEVQSANSSADTHLGPATQEVHSPTASETPSDTHLGPATQIIKSPPPQH